MKKSFQILALTLLFFTLYFVIDEMYFREVRAWFIAHISQVGISHILAYILIGTPLFIGTMVITSPKEFFSTLGLTSNPLKGAVLALLFTLPMFIGYATIFDFAGFDLNDFLIGGLSAGFFEELYFRAFLFGMIYRFTKFGFFPSIIIGAIWFGSVHLYQSQDFGTLIGIFMTTFMGAILFAWVYSEWKFNLWVPIFMHLFMNFSWMLFDVSDNALGNTWGNVFRYSTIALAIIFTVVYKLRNGKPLEITRNTLWMKKVA